MIWEKYKSPVWIGQPDTGVISTAFGYDIESVLVYRLPKATGTSAGRICLMQSGWPMRFCQGVIVNDTSAAIQFDHCFETRIAGKKVLILCQMRTIGIIFNSICFASLVLLALVISRVVRRSYFILRQRCPRCGYDMAKAGNIICSECGYERPIVPAPTLGP
jgi:ribosomal protein L37E